MHACDIQPPAHGLAGWEGAAFGADPRATAEVQRVWTAVASEACPLEGPLRLPQGRSSAGPAWPSNRCASPRAQREQMAKEQLQEERRVAARLQHANELRRQVREHQQKQVQGRIAAFEEGRRLEEEAQKRRERIADIKRTKLEELRCPGIPSSRPSCFPEASACTAGARGVEAPWNPSPPGPRLPQGMARWAGTGACSGRAPSPDSHQLTLAAALPRAPAESSGTGASWLAEDNLAGCWRLARNVPGGQIVAWV